jgi:hypothetical protein
VCLYIGIGEEFDSISGKKRLAERRKKHLPSWRISFKHYSPIPNSTRSWRVVIRTPEVTIPMTVKKKIYVNNLNDPLVYLLLDLLSGYYT